MMEKLTDEVLALFATDGATFQLNEISKLLKIKANDPEYFILRGVLDTLVDNGILLKSARRKYRLKESSDNGFIGNVEIVNDRCFVTTDSEEFPIVNIKFRYLNTALSGDTVRIKLGAEKKDKKPYGEVVEVIERVEHKIHGKIEFESGIYFLVPDEKKYYLDFIVSKSDLGDAKQGDKVQADFVVWTDKHRSPTAKVVSIVGAAGDPNVEYDTLIDEFELPREFPDGVVQEAEKFKKIDKSEFKNRLDLRKDFVITIDPKDARDFDDALSMKKLENGNYLVCIHIADVSHYVVENSELDIEARNRGNSVYLVDRVIPMLPENLSNNLCSLRPNEDRLAFSVIVELGVKGGIKSYKIAETVINSKRRYSYEEVHEILAAKEGENAEFLMEMNKLAIVLRNKRFQSGGIDFETSELRFELDENKNPIRALKKVSLDSMKLIEEFMLLANQIVAMHLEKMTKMQKQTNMLPYLFRIHEQPKAETIAEALRFVGDLVAMNFKKKGISSKEINAILHRFKGTPEETIVSQTLIRSLPKAIYSPDNYGHFGLGFKEYTHFTSPIRRYADLVIHRVIKEYEGAKIDKTRIDYLKLFMRSAAQHTTQTERSAMEAERASTKLTYTMMAKGRLQETFEGTVTGLTNFGLFVQVDEIYAEGLLKFREINDDYYHFDEKTMKLIGKRGKKVFKLGSRLTVRIRKVSVEKRQIDFDYLGFISS